MSQSKDWCFTDFADFEQAIPIYKLTDKVNYIVFQEEKCPETGKLHLQGFIQMKKKMRLGGMKKLFGDGVHFERRRGTVQQAIEYCKKSDSSTGRIFEEGTPTRQGARKDLYELMQMAAEGKTELEIADADPATWGRNYRAIERYRVLKMKHRMWPMEVHVRYGDTGAGKSRYIWENEDPDDVYSQIGGKWFDGYDGQSVILFDDFTGQMPLGLFLKVLDRYPLWVEKKGRHYKFAAKKIYITSNLSPEEWYPEATPTQHEAIRRRITTLTKFSNGLTQNGK